MSIKFRLIGSVTLIFLIVVGMFTATWFVTNSQRNDSLVINLAGRQRMLSQKIAKEALAYGHDGSEQLKQQIDKTITLFEDTLRALSNSGSAPTSLDPAGPKAQLPAPSEEVKTQLRRVLPLWELYKETVEQGVASNSPDGAAISSQSLDVLKSMNKAVIMMQSESEGRVTTLITAQIICICIGILIVIMVLLNLRTTLTKPLTNLQTFAGKVAEGDLDSEINGTFHSELLILKDAIVTMVNNLKQNMQEVAVKGKLAEKNATEAHTAMEEAKAQQEQVKELLTTMSGAAERASNISQSVAASVSQLTAQVDEVNQGTEVQRDRMSETATAMEEMNATVLEVARNASNAAESAGRARDNAQVGATGVQQAVESIDTVKEQMLALNNSMSELGQQAENIGKIMNVVTDIADQTNLLALNAAIEAARAGEAGRGFAVVADEVRKLAEKTMQATKEVGDAVSTIQNQARSNISAVENAVQDIVTSNEAASESGRFMTEIVNIVEETAGQVESIATASEQQSAASEEINLAITDVTQVAAETAEGMGEAMQALESMSAMARDLDSVITDMTAGNATPPTSQPAPAKQPAPKVETKRTPTQPVPTTHSTAPAPKSKRQEPQRSDRTGLKADNPKGMLQWSDDLSVNIREIDEQHLRLLNLINELHVAMSSGRGHDAVLPVIEELKNYTVFHFSTEEALFEEHEYPGMINHEATHKQFVDTVIDFEKQVMAGKASVTMDVMNFLKDWLVKHIKGTDKKYSSFMNDRGLY